LDTDIFEWKTLLAVDKRVTA